MPKIPPEIRKIQKETNKGKYKGNGYDIVEKYKIKSIMIYTEGEVSEYRYFSSLKKYAKSYLNIKICPCGANTLSVVEKAEDDFGKKANGQTEFIEQRTGVRFIQIWCVFDRDSFKAGFNNAIHKGYSSGYEIAFSNPCFELWYFLHENYQSTKIDRHDYKRKLENIYKIKYDKDKETAEKFVEILDSRYYPDKLEPVFANAIRLEEDNKPCSCCNNKSSLNTCYDCDPKTRVHYLVMLIMYKYLDYEMRNFIKSKYSDLVENFEKLCS